MYGKKSTLHMLSITLALDFVLPCTVDSWATSKKIWPFLLGQLALPCCNVPIGQSTLIVDDTDLDGTAPAQTATQPPVCMQ
jgi:hypothetical protein